MPEDSVNARDEQVGRFLRACSRHYDGLVEELTEVRKRSSPEAVLTWIELVADFAGMHHPGRFEDGAIENAALDLGRDLPRSSAVEWEPELLAKGEVSRADSRRRVLHVATVIKGIGGHTRTILNWMCKDRASQHSLALTSQGSVPIPRGFPDAIASAGGRLVSLPEEASIIARATLLRQVAVEHADLVVLHLVPYDVIPIAAFASPGGPPVALVNLADQCFWLGNTIADMVIQLREISLKTSREFRSTRNDQLLPIPLVEPCPALGRRDARKQLGIPDDEVALLSVGRTLKYVPSERQNFFRTASRILDLNPQARMYLVGVRADDHAGAAGFVHHERLRFVGPIEDVTLYQRAADVYLEGFPFGSQTALLESVLPGIPCVRAYAPETTLLATEDFALTGIVQSPRDEGEYIATASRFIADRKERERLGAVLRQRVLHFHVEESWNQYLEQVYRTLEALAHRPVEIRCSSSSSGPVHLAVNEYHACRLAGADVTAALAAEVRHRILGGAYRLRERGFHMDSFRFLRIANRRRAWDAAALSFTAKLVAHRVLYGLSRTWPRVSAIRPASRGLSPIKGRR
jgi:glycosyltransferase involved in cell wall biosynthesis